MILVERHLSDQTAIPLLIKGPAFTLLTTVYKGHYNDLDII